jgi:hypothetical protein
LKSQEFLANYLDNGKSLAEDLCMGRNSWRKTFFRELTLEELAHLLFLSFTDSREHQRDYLISLLGFVTYPDLDDMLSTGRAHEEARQLAIERVQAIDERRYSCPFGKRA